MLEVDRKLLAMDRDEMRNEFTEILLSSAQATIAANVQLMRDNRILSSSCLFRLKSERLVP